MDRDTELDDRPGASPANGPTEAGEGGAVADREPRRPAAAGPFQNRYGHWRAGWRLILYFAVALLLSIGVAPLAGLVPTSGGAGLTSWSSLAAFAGRAAVLALAAVVMLRFVDHRPVAMLGLGLEPGWRRELGLGIAAGFGLVAAVVLVLVVTGRVHLELAPDPAASLGALPRILLVLLFAAAVEELLFRGYPLQALGEGTRPWLAAVLSGGLFALVHLDNPDATGVAGVNIFVIGLLLAVGYLQTRRLWLPIGLHLSFNLTQGWLWGLDVSGYRLDGALLRAVPSGPDVVTGGDFGIEGSLVTTVLVAAVLGWAIGVRALRPAPAVAALWELHPRGFALEPEAGARPAEEMAQSLSGFGGDPSSSSGSADSRN